MTSGSDPKESAHERAARLEAMLDEIKDEPGPDGPDASAEAVASPELPASPEPSAAGVANAELSTPDLDQLDADWGDMGADESAKHELLASPKAAAVAARADLGKPEPVKADAPTSPKPVSANDDMLAGYADDSDDDDDYSAKTVIGRVPDLVALTRKEADAPLRTNLRTPRASPVQVAEPQRDVPTIRPEPKVVIDPEADFSSVAPPPVIPPAAALPAQPLSEPPPDAPTRMARVVLESAPPPAARPRSIPPPERDPAAHAAEKAAAEARAAQKKAKERARIESMRDRKKARAEAIARKQKAKQPRKSRPPPPPDSETEAGGSTMDSIPAPRDGSGDALAAAPRAGSTALARDWRRMGLLVVLVIAIGAIVLALVMRK